LVTSGTFLVSGSLDGSCKVWDLDDGSLLDAKAEPLPASILAVEMVGPLMVREGGDLRAAPATLHMLACVCLCVCVVPMPVSLCM